MLFSHKNRIQTSNNFLNSYKKKIYMGRSVDWNQIRTNGSMSGSGYATIQYDTIGTESTNLIYSNKYYVSLYARYGSGNTNVGSVWFKLGDFGTNEFVMGLNLTKIFLKYEKIGELLPYGTSTYLSGFQKSVSDGTLFIEWKNIQIFNLTQMFGAGYEPSTPTEFWAYFPNKIYPYNLGETQPLFKISRKLVIN